MFRLVQNDHFTLRQQETFFIEENFHVVDCGEEAANWISKFASENGSNDLRIGLHDGLYKRVLTNSHKQAVPVYPNITMASLGVYADLTSFMLMNQASVDDLLARLPNSNVSVNNFRPNIFICDDNLEPFEEDNWEYVKIGEVILKNTKPCTRCILTTIDPDTGTRNKNMEPLKTLKSYRLLKDEARRRVEKDSPVMGVHLGLITAGIINVGDVVSVPTK